MTPDELNAVTASVMEQLDELAAPLAARYERLLKAMGRRMSRKVRSHARAVVAAVIPPDEDEVIPADLGQHVQRLTEAERAAVVKTLVATYEAHEIAFDVHGVFTEELLAKVGAHAEFALEKDLRNVYRGVIETAAEEGYSVPRTASAITESISEVAGFRATALARTDLIGLANGASQAAATEAFQGREDVTKIWLATADDRTRETHMDADGQEVPLNEFFSVGADSLMYPGDPDGTDEEVINCRCTLIYSGSSAGGEAESEAELASVHPGSYAIPMSTTEPTVEQVSVRTPWSGIMAIVGKPTSDGRYLIPGEFAWRDLPLPFAGSHGKQEASESAGRVETVELIPAGQFDKPGWELPDDTPDTAEVVWVEGTFDGSPDAVDAMRNLENGAGVSIDFLVERRALIDADTFEEVDPADVMDTDDILGMLFGGTPEGYLDGMGGKVGGLSLANISAFEETTIRVEGDHAIVAAAFPIRFHVETETVKPLVASGAPIAPPRAWFFMEEPDEPTPITIEDDGRFYGHMALWNSCHAGRSNGVFADCMYAPASPSRYMNFHLSAIRCDDGSDVPVGKITIGTGHAPLNLNAAAARAHYDHTGTVVGYCRATDGIFGIFVCGAIKSDATAEQIRDFRASPPSGDWRAVDGRLEMQAVLAVNVPGYVVPRSQLALAASAGDDLSVSAMVLGPPSVADYVEAAVAEQQFQVEDNVTMLFDLTPLDAA